MRPDVREMTRKVNTRVEPEIVTADNLGGGATVTIRTKDGKEYSKSLYHVKGHPKNPMVMGDVVEKFSRCLPFSAKPLPEENSEEIVKMVSNPDTMINAISRFAATWFDANQPNNPFLSSRSST